MNVLNPVQPGLWPILGAMIGAVVVSSIVRLVTVRRTDARTRAARLSSLRVWWFLALAFTGALLLGRVGVCALFATATALAMREYLALIDAPRGLLELAVLGGLVVAAYGLLLFGQTTLFLVGIPAAALVLVPILVLARGGTTNLLRRVAGQYWGVILLVWGTGHVVMYYDTLPPDAGGAGPAGWIVFVVLLTEMNDIGQAVTGRMFARRHAHHVTPRVSPRKTWEGLLGGIAVTMTLTMALAPWLTDLDEVTPTLGSFTVESPSLLAAALGLLIAVGGFLGDINMSALKRAAGKKDAGHLLGGMGGMIDRIDSLTVTAPIAAWFMMWAHP